MKENPLVAQSSLGSQLQYTPQELRFGTSGRRGLVIDLTQLEIYVTVLAELQYLKTLPLDKGGLSPGGEIYVASDLRPSSTAYVAEQSGRGEIAQAVFQAIRDAGMTPVFLGKIPTPALTFYAVSGNKGSVMVTGSHIPFDRNGYKMNTSMGELLKEHEAPITESVSRIRNTVYAEPLETSLFDTNGRLKTGHHELPAEDNRAAVAYLKRYSDFFAPGGLAGERILLYQHSAVGRDLLQTLLESLGAEVISSGRSDNFVPIDTENIDALQLNLIQQLASEATAAYGPLDAVVSTDGDSDRPLILGVDPATGQVQFYGGDLVGMVVAGYLRADAVVVPISCNDAIDRGQLAGILETKTRIGSPYVIAGIEAAIEKGKQVVCGWEANGGFLLGSDVRRDGRLLRALPTRDAFLPILATLYSAHEARLTLRELFAKLPERFSRAALIKDFPRSTSLKIIQLFSPSKSSIQEIEFNEDQVRFSGEDSPSELDRLEAVKLRDGLERLLLATEGFGEITRLNYIDGVRILFSTGDVMHIRPSGNADELRVYAVADTQQRANEIASAAVAEPDGILRRLEASTR